MSKRSTHKYAQRQAAHNTELTISKEQKSLTQQMMLPQHIIHPIPRHNTSCLHHIENNRPILSAHITIEASTRPQQINHSTRQQNIINRIVEEQSITETVLTLTQPVRMKTKTQRRRMKDNPRQTILIPETHLHIAIRRIIERRIVLQEPHNTPPKRNHRQEQATSYSAGQTNHRDKNINRSRAQQSQNSWNIVRQNGNHRTVQQHI